jgi:hypothetical protein
MGNIIVDSVKIVAIIDWELGGYYLWWVEVHTSYRRALSDNADELFDAVWKEMGLSRKGLMKHMKHIAPVMKAFEWCPVAHTGDTHIWHRPAFCKCQPIGGRIYKRHIDSEEKHYVAYERRGPLMHKEEFEEE